MSTDERLVDPDFEAVLERFEKAWRSNPTAPNISDFLTACVGDTIGRQRLLHELILVDLEYRWRRSGREARPGADSDPSPWLLDDYAAEFLELWPVEQLPIELIAEEYRARRRWGDRPAHDDYFARFPGRQAALAAALQDVNRDLALEAVDEAPLRTPASLTEMDSTEDRPLLTERDVVLQLHLGTGGVGRVYRAILRDSGRTVAVKILKKASQQDPLSIRRLLEEGDALASLRHPGIVRLQHVGRMRNGIVFLVMDFIEGSDLERALADAPIPWAQAAHWMGEAAEALQHAHNHGVIHCDLKPANLLLGRDGRVRLTDFGLAARLHVGGRERGLGGTLGFMAPEQIDATWGPIGPQTDVFGLGAVLAALLLGTPPCGSASLPESLGGILEERHLLPLESLSGAVPKDLLALCRRALAPAIDDRWASAAEFCAACRSALPEWTLP